MSLSRAQNILIANINSTVLITMKLTFYQQVLHWGCSFQRQKDNHTKPERTTTQSQKEILGSRKKSAIKNHKSPFVAHLRFIFTFSRSLRVEFLVHKNDVAYDLYASLWNPIKSLKLIHEHIFDNLMYFQSDSYSSLKR